MPSPARLRRMNTARTRDPIVFIVRFSPGRWPRVPPWRPRPPALPPPRDGLPPPDAGNASPTARPALLAPTTPEIA